MDSVIADKECVYNLHDARADRHIMATNECVIFLIDVCDEITSEWAAGKSRLTAVCDCKICFFPYPLLLCSSISD